MPLDPDAPVTEPLPPAGLLPQAETQPEPLTEPREGVPPVLTTPAELDDACARLAAGTGPVAVDVERASGYRYSQRAYLVQLRRAGAGTVLIDPIELPDLSGLNAALAGTEWVLHAADQDLPSLGELGMSPDVLFDTELAARLLGRPRVGLSALIAEELGYALAKEHSAADWSQRPLPVDWLRYAALDVELLVELRDVLAADLRAAGKDEWARQEFEHERTAPPPAPKVDPWRRVPGASAVRSPRGLAVVRELWAARDELARALDRSPGRVLANGAIVAAARARPGTDLLTLPEFAGKGTRRHIRRWQAAAQRAAALPEDALPPRRAPHEADRLPAPRSWPDRNPEAAERLEAVKTVVRARAEELGLPQENLLAPVLQRHLAWHGTGREDADGVRAVLAGAGARPWQVDQVADLLAGALAGVGRPPA